MYCTSCLKQIGDDYKVCPYCGKGLPQKRKVTDADNLPLGYSPKKNKLLVIVIAAVVLILFLFTLAPNVFYRLKLQKFHDTIRDAAVETEIVCNTIADVWYDAMAKQHQEHTAPYTQWNGRFYDDFADALDLLDSSMYMASERKNIAQYQKKLEKQFQSLRYYPDKYADHYEWAELLYKAFNLLANNVHDFHGLTYEEYTEISATLIEAFWDGSSAFNSLMNSN